MTASRRPALPSLTLELLGRSESSPGFLQLTRSRYRVLDPTGGASREFVYDSVQRRALDAVVVAAYYFEADIPFVYLRSALRPPLGERSERTTADAGVASLQLWELPAGLVEAGEESPAGLRVAAARETNEELGFELDPERFMELGHGIYPTPAVIAERQFFFRVEVDPGARAAPALDGSPLEANGAVFASPLSEALALCQAGEILDGKTELGLLRLHGALTRRA